MYIYVYIYIYIYDIFKVLSSTSFTLSFDMLICMSSLFSFYRNILCNIITHLQKTHRRSKFRMYLHNRVK